MKPVTQATVASLLRAILVFVGVNLIGHNLPFIGPIAAETWDIILGGIMTAFGLIWGIVTKDTDFEKAQSAVRSIIVAFGGLFVANHKLSQGNLDAILGTALAALPLFQSYFGKKTNIEVANPDVPVGVNVANGKVIKINKAA